MNPVLRRALPFAGPFVVGVLGYLLLGAGPHSSASRDTVPVDWALPVDAAPDMAAAAELWRSRSPWGAVAAGADAASDATDQAILPVGVFKLRDGLVALFAIPDAPLLRVRQGDRLPNGGQVTSISATGVGWTNAKGETRQRQLFIDPDPRTTAPVDSPPPRRRASTSSQGQ